MKAKSRKVYLFFIVFYVFLIALSTIAFSMIPNPASYPEGFFITPGGVQFEWIFAVVMPGITGTIAGVVSIFLVSPIFIKTYAKRLAKKHKIGLAPVEDMSSSTLFRKMWARSIILGFFVGNICFTLAGQEIIVELMRSVSPLEPYSIPDVETLWQLAWIVVVPSSFIVIPIYAMNDVGLIVAKKVKGFQFTSSNLASRPLYKVIKGFAGIGFLYNLIVMIIFWVSGSLQVSGFDLSIVIQIISPLIAAGSAFPGIIILESLKTHNRNQAEKGLRKLGLNSENII